MAIIIGNASQKDHVINMLQSNIKNFSILTFEYINEPSLQVHCKLHARFCDSCLSRKFLQAKFVSSLEQKVKEEATSFVYIKLNCAVVLTCNVAYLKLIFLVERFSTQLCTCCPDNKVLWFKTKLLGADKSCRIKQLH